MLATAVDRGQESGRARAAVRSSQLALCLHPRFFIMQLGKRRRFPSAGTESEANASAQPIGQSAHVHGLRRLLVRAQAAIAVQVANVTAEEPALTKIDIQACDCGESGRIFDLQASGLGHIHVPHHSGDRGLLPANADKRGKAITEAKVILCGHGEWSRAIAHEPHIRSAFHVQFGARCAALAAPQFDCNGWCDVPGQAKRRAAIVVAALQFAIGSLTRDRDVGRPDGDWRIGVGLLTTISGGNSKSGMFLSMRK